MPPTPFYELQMIGTAVFAVTGVLAVNRRGLDLFGAVVLGCVTSLGGGTIRDLVIGAPVFWLNDLNYVWAALIAAHLAFFASRSFVSTYTLLLYLDGLGAALFAVFTAEKVLARGHGPIARRDHGRAHRHRRRPRARRARGSDNVADVTRDLRDTSTDRLHALRDLPQPRR